MIDLYYWPTPNGHKVSIALEEMELPYTVIPINIGQGEQFQERFLAITPNHRIPAIVDPEGPDGKPYPLFESAAILIYLAEKTGMFLPADPAARFRCLEWLMFQMGGVGPMFGQANHFISYAPERIGYAVDRYTSEVKRLFNVLEKRLGRTEYLGGDYSIADMATYPWCRLHERYGVELAELPAVSRWMEACDARPGVSRGLAVLADRRRSGPITDEERENMFGATQYQRR